MTNVKKQDFTRRISRANPTEMIVILYDMVLTYVQDAKEAADVKDYDEFHKQLMHIQGCISELNNSLHEEYELAKTLKSLYFYCLRRIATSDARKDSEILEEIIKIIEPLRDAYSQIAKDNPAGPVMGNSQEVYVGLTYGKSNLTENLTVQANRGFYI